MIYWSEGQPTGEVEVDNDNYHAGPGVSKSQLDAIAVSPLNFWDQYVNPEREPREYKHCFAVGDGTHKLILEPGTFEQHYAVGFDKSAHPGALDTTADLKAELKDLGLPVSGTKPELIQRLRDAEYDDKPILATLEAEHIKGMGARQPMPARDYRNMMKMLEAVHGHHTAGGLLIDAHVERSYYAADSRGILRRCRPDVITADGQFIVDLKTTDDVSLFGFGATIAKRRYDVQAAWYLDVMALLYGSDAPQAFAFIAVQKTRPFDCAVHFLTPEQIDRGRAIYQRDLGLLHDCLQRDEWPGADGGQVLEARLPKWAMDQVAA